GGVISGNLAENIFDQQDGGGGLWSTLGGGVGGGLTMTDTQVLNNRTSHGGGGGLAIDNDSAATLSGLTVAHNWVPNYLLGGGIFIKGNVVVDRTAIVTNTGGEGGGMAVLIGSAVTLTQVTVSGNTSRDSGGGLRVSDLAQVSVQDSQITANIAELHGGGINNAGTLDIQNSTVSGNHSADGGGVGNDGTLWLINSTLSGNFADNGGGGLSNVTSNSQAYLNNVTVVNNLADADANGSGQGGGLWSSVGALFAVNTLIAQNNSLGLNKPDCSGTINSGGYNLIQSATGCTLSGTLTGNVIGLSPKIGPLKDNGGSTWTHALLSGSPAIDAGNPSGTFLDFCLLTDQRGVHRPIGPRCDIGAVEANRLGYLPLVVR
ncbi:MAG: hypothetical protein KA765_13905, partial [Thermoflexales bacterium]|nr:hypothetical protein [Thermoflexales bacterium]